MPVTDCEKKWNTLKARYKKSSDKRKKAERSDSGATAAKKVHARGTMKETY